MGARLDYARALAGAVTNTEAAPSILATLNTIEKNTPNASDLEIYRGAFIAAAEALAGDDADAWHLLLVGFVTHHARRLLEVRDGGL